MRALFCLLLLGVFAVGCGDSGPPSAKGACNKANTTCQGMGEPMDCAQAQADYDAASDEEKAQMDQVNQCVISSADCMAVSMCWISALENAFEDMGMASTSEGGGESPPEIETPGDSD